MIHHLSLRDTFYNSREVVVNEHWELA